MHTKYTPTIDGPDFIGRIPPEVAHTICSYLPLGGPDIANLRLVSRFWTDVATPRLLPRVHLIFHLDSFKRLAAISNHSVISQHVTHLFYEPDALRLYESQQEWENDILGSSSAIEIPSEPEPGASERDYHVYNRACVKYAQDPRHQLQKDQSYMGYRRLLVGQERLQEQNYGASIISDALSRMPKLYSISMSLGCISMPSSLYLCKGFKVGFERPYGDVSHGPAARILQFRSMLLGSHHAGRQLTRLVIGGLNWQFLRDETESMSMMKQSLRQMRVLDLNITNGNSSDEVEIGVGVSECREYLANHALCEFIKAAPDLESLSIAFRYSSGGSTRLKHIVCDQQWTKLKRVEFEGIDATQTDLANFCTRHASTLKHLGLSAMRLLERGSWVSTLEAIQKTLSLESAEFRGVLVCKDPPQYWALGATAWEDEDDEEVQGNVTAKALSTYLVHGGSCPLLDEKSHPNLAL